MTRKLLTWIVVLSTLGMLSLSASAEDAQSPKSEVQSLAAGRENGARPKTWKALAELSAEEKVSLDLRADSPRDSQFPYLPAEKFPFTAPYTAEEMGIRSMEYPHSPYWNCTLIDIASTVTNTGFMDQRVTIIPILYLPKGGFAEQLYNTQPGKEVYRWLSQSVSPPERYGNQTLYVGYRNDQTFTTELDLFAYSPSLRRIRRQPQPRRQDRLPNSASTLTSARSNSRQS